MPVTTQRIPRSTFTSPTSDTLFTRKSLFSHHNNTADNFFRRSSFGTYRCIGDDTTPTGTRFGVSTRFSSSSSSTSTPSSSSSLSTRLSIDRDFRKPPIGLSRIRSNSRSRDLSVDRSYLTTSKQNDSLHSNSNHSNDSNSKRSSSLARSLATSGADLYEKYSVANYKPKCELSRSRSLTDSTANKLVDSISSNSNSHSASSRATSRDRALCGGHLSTRRDSSPVSIGVAKARSSLRSELPPTPSRFLNRDRDRDGKTSYTSSRAIADSDAFSKSLASSSISDKSDDTTEGLCGLRNIGNTCYMNSIIQCLGHTKDLTRSLKLKSEVRSAKDQKDGRICTEFIKLLKDMWSGSNRSVTPSELKSAFSSKHRMYSGCAQQDAQEFLRFFLDSLHCALNSGTAGEKLEIDDNLPNNRKADLTWDWYSKVENSVIIDLFVGQLKSSLKCTTCGNTSVTFDPFWDLSVSLPTSSRCKLESCLDLFIKEEVLDGDEMPTCAKCKTRRKCTKSFTIQRFPKYLAIHLKRFSETRWSKLSNLVEFPTGERELNMGPYGANTSSAQYSLYGICNHMGSTAGGHYVAVCKHPVTRKWHEFNDNAVNSTSENSLVSSSAYVLFYERV